MPAVKAPPLVRAAACFVAALSCSQAAPPPAALPSITQVAGTGTSLAFATADSAVTIQLCRPNLVKVTVTKTGQPGTPAASLWEHPWPAVAGTSDLQGDALVLRTDQIVVKVNRASGRVSFFDPQGQLLIKENDEEGVYQTWQKGVHFNTRSGSRFFGIRGWDYLEDSRGQMELRPSAQPYPIKAGAEGYTGGPLLWSNLGFGVFVATEKGFCYIRSDADVRFWDLSGDQVTYYVMAGNAYQVQAAIADLTGKPPMFPKWALGFSNSEFVDMNETRCLDNIAGYRSRGIPLDLYTFDFQWKAWGDDHYGEVRWNPANFPHGPSGEFARQAGALGVKLAGIMKPRIHVDSEQGRYATEHHFWVPGRSPYLDYFSGKLTNDLDFTIPACRQWYWDHAAAAFDSGIVGWWNDEADAWGSPWESMDMAQALYEGQRAHTHDQVRVWTNNRNFFSGSQKYAYATWSGDIESGFGVMQQQRERLLCSVNVGQARWGMDTGGFNNNYHVPTAELDECFARWMEFAAFVPIFRTHGTSYRQPWLFGARAEAAARAAVRLRYSLIPYMYAYDHQLHETGVGLVRPLVWDYPTDPHVVNRVDAWMFGESLLVAPVVDPGQSVKPIYLPAGQWIDFFRGQRWTGGQEIAYPVDAQSLLDIPLFLKAGAILPSMEVQNYVGEHPVPEIAVDVFPAAKPTSFTYYDDDGTTYDYEKNRFFEQQIQTVARTHETDLNLGARQGDFMPALQWYLFKIHGQPYSGRGAIEHRFSTLPDLESAPDEGWASGTDRFGPVLYLKIRAGTARAIRLTQS